MRNTNNYVLFLRFFKYTLTLSVNKNYLKINFQEPSPSFSEKDENEFHYSVSLYTG